MSEPKCTGPFSDAFDCPVHDPRKRNQADAARPAVTPEIAKDVFPEIEDVLFKHQRGSPHEQTTRGNVAALLDRILTLDSDRVQRLQKAEQRLMELEARPAVTGARELEIAIRVLNDHDMYEEADKLQQKAGRLASAGRLPRTQHGVSVSHCKTTIQIIGLFLLCVSLLTRPSRLL